MKFDVIIIGSELDALIASIRLNELGYTSKIIANGKGSILYSLGNIKILKSKNNPFSNFQQLSNNHPYNILGKENVMNSIDWFIKYTNNMNLGYLYKKENMQTISALGIIIESYGLYLNQVNFNELLNTNISIISFKNQRDFHPNIIKQTLYKLANKIEIVEICPPDNNKHIDNASLAHSFDNIKNIEKFIIEVNSKINKNSEILLFPAVLGINKYNSIIKKIENTLKKKCFEIPTLPPSIPGIRLNNFLENEILKYSSINRNAKIIKANIKDDKCLSLIDNNGRLIEGKSYIFANGGILMGGLEVESNGKIVDKIFNSKINQTNPINQNKSFESLKSLQNAGVVTNEELKPFCLDNKQTLNNVYFTGRNLSNWNPSVELSNEGVSIATGWFSAKNIANSLT